ncbi:MAG: glutaminase A [Synergistes sp.]|nr:glutaminase A [Synergistes sp.]
MDNRSDLLDEQLLNDVGNIARVTSTDGKVASYIPELSRMSAELFSLSCQPVGAKMIEIGDVGQFFTMQSLSKIISLAFAIEKFGRENVFRHAGMEASADSFNSLMRIEMTSSKPSNPFMNAGAIAVCSLICKAYKSEALDRVTDFLRLLTGEYNGFDEKVFLSEKNSADRNRALAYFMKSMGLLHGDVEEILDLYFTLCSLRCTSGTLARTAAVIASGGRSAASGEKVIEKETVCTLLGLMSTCGLYNESGEFAVRVGLPGKSGVSGGIMAVVPGRMGIGVFSPALDAKGNSVAGIRALELLSEKLDLRGIGI